MASFAGVLGVRGASFVAEQVGEGRDISLGREPFGTGAEAVLEACLGAMFVDGKLARILQKHLLAQEALGRRG